MRAHELTLSYIDDALSAAQVDKKALLEPLGILGPEFAEVCASISALVPVEGPAPSGKVKTARVKKRKESENDENADPEPGTLGSIREAAWCVAWASGQF